MVIVGVQSHCLVVVEYVIIRVTRTVKHSKGWHDEPSRWLIIEDVLPLGRREHVVGTSNRCYIRGQAFSQRWGTLGHGRCYTADNAEAFLGTPFGWFCPRSVSFLARRNGHYRRC